MTMSTPIETSTADEELSPPLGDLLLKAATNPRDQAAVRALVEEGRLLARKRFWTALVVERNGEQACNWEGMAGKVYTLGLDTDERAFLGLVLSIVGVRQSALACVEELDERQLAAVLRAMVRLSPSDSIAVGTRI
ncbi:hypothetical protein ABZU94_13935 [Streptomyces mirabilis]|uniref:hypothetical protein n=1 Tax=Streptomyces sp. NPDC005388 TaxID=3156717 RepID=UPI0033BFB404